MTINNERPRVPLATCRYYNGTLPITIVNGIATVNNDCVLRIDASIKMEASDRDIIYMDVNGSEVKRTQLNSYNTSHVYNITTLIINYTYKFSKGDTFNLRAYSETSRNVSVCVDITKLM